MRNRTTTLEVIDTQDEAREIPLSSFIEALIANLKPMYSSHVTIILRDKVSEAYITGYIDTPFVPTVGMRMQFENGFSGVVEAIWWSNETYESKAKYSFSIRMAPLLVQDIDLAINQYAPDRRKYQPGEEWWDLESVETINGDSLYTETIHQGSFPHRPTSQKKLFMVTVSASPEHYYAIAETEEQARVIVAEKGKGFKSPPFFLPEEYEIEEMCSDTSAPWVSDFQS